MSILSDRKQTKLMKKQFFNYKIKIDFKCCVFFEYIYHHYSFLLNKIHYLFTYDYFQINSIHASSFDLETIYSLTVSLIFN